MHARTHARTHIHRCGVFERRCSTSWGLILKKGFNPFFFVLKEVISKGSLVSEAECCFTSTETVGLLGTGAQDGHLDFHTAPEL